MKMILLSRGKEAVVDDEDYEILSQYNWVFSGGYAQASGRAHLKHPDRRMMHRMIMGLPFEDERMVDHIDTDRLNNRKENLRITDRTGNTQNALLRCDSVTGMKGVSKTKSAYIANIQGDLNPVYLGSFGTAAEAAHAYNKAAIELHGEFARLNPVDGFVDQDARVGKANNSGYTGVQLRDGIYTARIQRNGVSTVLGSFKDFESAKNARKMAEQT